MDKNEFAANTLDEIPSPRADAKRIVGLVKQNGKVTGYKLSDESFVDKHRAVQMAKNGEIEGVGIAHRGDSQYLKAIPDESENNNLGNLPAVSPNK